MAAVSAVSRAAELADKTAAHWDDERAGQKGDLGVALMAGS